MYGAIAGDIIGSRFEFDRGDRTKEFALFAPACSFTDDTVMTLAVAEALMKSTSYRGKGGLDEEEIRRETIACMRKWGHRYPDAGYGGRFWRWLFTARDPKPYGSWGNGSAMRVSAAGWLFDTVELTRQAARATAAVTHDHPEGIKGAECTAAVIFLARTGHSKAVIRAYVELEFGYDLSETLDQLRARHAHDESCMDSLPKALTSFFEGKDYEDTVRNAVSLGGDTDTLAAIAGAMAEGMYGMPEDIWARAQAYLPEDEDNILGWFTHRTGYWPGHFEHRFMPEDHTAGGSEG